MTWSDKAAMVIGLLALAGGTVNVYQFAEKERQQRQNPNWLNILSDTSGAQVTFDATSLAVDGPLRTAWVRIEFSPPRRMGAEVMNNSPITRYLMLSSYDCARRTMQLSQVIAHNINGESQSQTIRELPEVVAPGTNGQPMLDAICSASTRSWFRWVRAFVGVGR